MSSLISKRLDSLTLCLSHVCSRLKKMVTTFRIKRLLALTTMKLVTMVTRIRQMLSSMMHKKTLKIA